MDKILEVKKLKLSFRTPGGTLKAVRDISFDLERGKTLAIVGESGSGKSVTSKAILGILAGNSIIEGGEILYDGNDLLKIPESEMYKIRGDKISMIFQDPLSSLNPIVKIGKQITEAMLLKNKANRKQARKDFNELLSLLKKSMISAGHPEDKISKLVETFDKFNIEAIKLENSYNDSYTEALDLKSAVDDFLFLMSKNQKLAVKDKLSDFIKRIKNISDPFFVYGYADKLQDFKVTIKALRKQIKPNEPLSDELVEALEDLVDLISEMTENEKPNFFRIGFYNLANPGADLSKMPIEEANQLALTYLDDNFMNEFISLIEDGLKHSFNGALELKKSVLSELTSSKEFYLTDFSKKEAYALCDKLCNQVKASIDPLEINKDSIPYTFRSALTNAVDRYFYFKVKNPKEEARFARQSKKYDAMIARGKRVDWKVVPKTVADLNDLKADITSIIDRIYNCYVAYIAEAGSVDFHKRAVEMINFFKEKASQVVFVLTKGMARERAIKLMEEVGINEPRIRYYQYPFEFSGGMRQRIVIAIALAANPDILICDEPTTALDVTIQAQILELINKLKKERNLSVIFITHDLGVVANMADDIAVMYAGKIVEYGTAEDIFYDPKHPYTWALLSSMPDLDTNEKLDAIPGTPPNLIYPPVGDAFADRNKYAMAIDFEMQPPMFEISETHRAATWLLHPDAPKVEMPKIISDRIARMKKAEELRDE